MPITFETQRLHLSPTQLEDAPFIYELMNTPKFHQYIGDRNISSVEIAREYIQTKMLPQLELLGYSNYTIRRKEDQAKVGTCGLYSREGLEGIDIGFAMLPQFERQGYGFEATSRLLKAAFEEFDLSLIKGITSKENTASQQLLQKLGLQFAGTTYFPNDPEELFLYQIERPENQQ